jgi:hypothetical protein
MIILGGVAAFLIIWDIYAAFFNDIPNQFDTESGIMRRVGARFAGIPFAWGALGGHFWGPSIELPGDAWFWAVGLGGLAIGITGIHFLIRRTFLRPPQWFALVYLVAGIPAGAVLWAQ